mmetsp:Transcript_41284/g.119410  ORF Transcript_41284/g.119410 Transcript_41284/m.119410 type:complete len:364 (-) Transcript_41284:134-1225(-)
MREHACLKQCGFWGTEPPAGQFCVRGVREGPLLLLPQGGSPTASRTPAGESRGRRCRRDQQRRRRSQDPAECACLGPGRLHQREPLAGAQRQGPSERAELQPPGGLLRARGGPALERLCALRGRRAGVGGTAPSDPRAAAVLRRRRGLPARGGHGVASAAWIGEGGVVLSRLDGGAGGLCGRRAGLQAEGVGRPGGAQPARMWRQGADRRGHAVQQRALQGVDSAEARLGLRPHGLPAEPGARVRRGRCHSGRGSGQRAPGRRPLQVRRAREGARQPEEEPRQAGPLPGLRRLQLGVRAHQRRWSLVCGRGLHRGAHGQLLGRARERPAAGPHLPQPRPDGGSGQRRPAARRGCQRLAVRHLP